MCMRHCSGDPIQRGRCPFMGEPGETDVQNGSDDSANDWGPLNEFDGNVAARDSLERNHTTNSAILAEYHGPVLPDAFAPR